MPTRAFLKLYPERRTEILSVCMEEFARRGYAAASTNVMAKRLGVAKGSLYYWFGSKETLYRYLVEEAKRELDEQRTADGSADPVEGLRAAVTALLGLMERSPASCALLLGAPDGGRGGEPRSAGGAARPAALPPAAGAEGESKAPVDRLLGWVASGLRDELAALCGRPAADAGRASFGEGLDAALALLARALPGGAPTDR